MTNAKARKGNKSGKTMADQADRHVLYQKSVQAPETEVEFFEDSFKELRGRTPRTMREDFCGTAALSMTWVARDNKRRAIGVDICQETLDWGIRHNLKPAGEDVASRITLLNENVVDVETEEVDLICAMNFSYCIFKTRQALLNYFKNARRGLKEDGLFFLDLLGGTATIDTVEEEREIEDEDATYVWEQAEFNPITNHLMCYIHFDFEDGSRMERAFEYDWRLWSIPEIHEILLDAGFSKVNVYWEEFEEDDDDPDNDYLVGTGNFRKVTEVDQQESWLAYIVAEK
ncbi:MAG: class I SAM-dependent methyltransferase [Gammaproteobacteria bacterium]|nr:class I SAM-dependent methyltransferase [Gammaproteobacteria bacterium]